MMRLIADWSVIALFTVQVSSICSSGVHGARDEFFPIHEQPSGEQRQTKDASIRGQVVTQSEDNGRPRGISSADEVAMERGEKQEPDDDTSRFSPRLFDSQSDAKTDDGRVLSGEENEEEDEKEEEAWRQKPRKRSLGAALNVGRSKSRGRFLQLPVRPTHGKRDDETGDETQRFPRLMGWRWAKVEPAPELNQRERLETERNQELAETDPRDRRNIGAAMKLIKTRNENFRRMGFFGSEEEGERNRRRMGAAMNLKKINAKQFKLAGGYP